MSRSSTANSGLGQCSLELEFSRGTECIKCFFFSFFLPLCLYPSTFYTQRIFQSDLQSVFQLVKQQLSANGNSKNLRVVPSRLVDHIIWWNPEERFYCKGSKELTIESEEKQAKNIHCIWWCQKVWPSYKMDLSILKKIQLNFLTSNDSIKKNLSQIVVVTVLLWRDTMATETLTRENL